MSTPRLVFGAGGIGSAPKGFTYTWESPEAVSKLLTRLSELELLELDSAASYPPGNPWNTETLLGQAGTADKDFVIDSKISVHDGNKLDDEHISASLGKSLDLLNAKKVHILYAHAPSKTPIEETAAAFHKQYLAGKFEKLGLCNHTPKQWAEYIRVCEDKGYVKPSVCQNQYNALARDDEAELLPLLRKHGVSYYAYSPLAGGFLTGKVTFSGSLDRTRWEGESAHPMYTALYNKPKMHDALRNLHAVCQKHQVSVKEASLRWLIHHSALGGNDAIILGASKVEQLEGNLAECKKAPLPGEVRQAMEDMWMSVKGHGGFKV